MVWYLVTQEVENAEELPGTFSFRDPHQRYVVQGIKWSTLACLVVARTSRRRGRIVCEKGVRYASSGVGPSNCQDLLRGASVGLVPILVLYRVTSTALFPRLQLWNLHWPVSVEPVGDLHSQVLVEVHFPSHLLPSSIHEWVSVSTLVGYDILIMTEWSQSWERPKPWMQPWSKCVGIDQLWCCMGLFAVRYITRNDLFFAIVTVVIVLGIDYGICVIDIELLLLHFAASLCSTTRVYLRSVASGGGWDSSVGIATRYELDGPGNPGGNEIFRTRPDRPWGPPSLLYNGYRVFLGGKAAGAWRWPPTHI